MSNEHKPEPCKTCGTCPTCGRGPYQFAPPVYPWWQQWPYTYTTSVGTWTQPGTQWTVTASDKAVIS